MRCFFYNIFPLHQQEKQDPKFNKSATSFTLKFSWHVYHIQEFPALTPQDVITWAMQWTQFQETAAEISGTI